MGKSKKPQHVAAVLGVSSLVLLLLMSSAVQDAAAMEGSINYGVFKGDEDNGKDKDLFRPGAEDTANNYTRGCEKIERCREAATNL